MAVMKPAPAVLAVGVTTWPPAGIALLVLVMLVLVVAAVLVNLRPGGAAPPDETLEAIGPPGSDDALAGDNPPHDV